MLLKTVDIFLTTNIEKSHFNFLKPIFTKKHTSDPFFTLSNANTET